jgi:propanol-preferring alcohol dehydrogenase
MRAWCVDRPGPVSSGPMRWQEDRTVPEPAEGEVLVRVSACGVCRTDLHLAEGDLPPRGACVVPGHQVVGVVEALGPACRSLRAGERVGVAWLGGTCGRCRFCTTGRENLCLEPTFTGWDRDGGYAEYVSAREDYVYPLPEGFDDEAVAPLLCAGIIGFRALRRAELPPGGRLGIYGFGASAHITAQVAIGEGAEVHVMTRAPAARELARSLGAASVQGATDRPPVPLDSAILFAPAGDLVPPALEALDRGGTLAVAGIHLTAIPPLDYDRHLFEERTLRSVTANTRDDGREFLATAARLGIRVTTTAYPLGEADRALADLAGDRVNGAAVLRV